MDEIADFRSSFITHNNFHYNCKLSFSVLISTLKRENLEALFSIPIFENYLIYQEKYKWDDSKLGKRIYNN